MRAKKGQKVRINNPEFGCATVGSIYKCVNIETDGMDKFESITLIDEEDYHTIYISENIYEIIQDPETITPSMVVISWADWLEYQNLKNKQNV